MLLLVAYYIGHFIIKGSSQITSVSIISNLSDAS